MKNIWFSILLASALLSACGAPAPAGQGIRGLVLLGPNCPVVQEGVPCPDMPYQVELAVTSPDGMRVIKTFSSNTDGTFEVTLPVGEYTIRSLQQGGMPYCAIDQTVTVSAGSMTETTVFCDTGIR